MARRAGEKAAPLLLNGLRVKYYTPEEITGIWLASPDEESAVSTSLIFEKGRMTMAGIWNLRCLRFNIGIFYI